MILARSAMGSSSNQRNPRVTVGASFHSSAILAEKASTEKSACHRVDLRRYFERDVRHDHWHWQLKEDREEFREGGEVECDIDAGSRCDLIRR